MEKSKKYLKSEEIELKRIDSFKRLANNRVNRAIKAIQLVSNLSNKSHYKYTESQAKKIILALEKEIRELKSKFNNSKNNVHGDYFEID